MPPRYRLRLKRLDFVSLVDDPAQPNAKCLLIKRRGDKHEIEATTARLVKTNDELGLAFFWAFTSTNADGTDHFDLQGDQVVSDDEMIKTAMSFMENGGAVDEMHDEDPDGGRVVFAMPMTPEIAKAFGVATKTSGLMIAIKPSADAMAKLKDGTYRAVSIGGIGERVAVKSAGRVVKSTLYTNEIDGHQHEVCVWEDGTLSVRYATSAGADREHSHGIVFENGTLTILADSGHTHELAEGQPGIAMVPADAIVIVANRAAPTKNAHPITQPARNSTPGKGASTVKAQQEPTPMNIAKALAAILAMTASQQAYVSKLAPDEVEPFLSKPAHERDAIMKAAEDADPVVYKTAAGVEIRKSAGELAVMLAKQNDDQAKKLAENSAELAKANDARELEVLKAQVKTDLGHLAGSDDTKVIALKALKSISDEKARGEVLTMLKAADAAMKSQGAAIGVTPEGDAAPSNKESAFASLSKGLVAFCTEQKIAKLWTEGLDAFVKTPAGDALNKAYESAK
jgi:hypothetical protein